MVNIISKRLKIKFFIFFIFTVKGSGIPSKKIDFRSTLLMLLFWYYISCFCAVFINTQIILIKDSIFSFILSNCYVFGLNLIIGLFRIYSLSKAKDKYISYRLSQILSLL